MNIILKKNFVKILFFAPFFAEGLKPVGPLALSLSGAGRATVQKGAEYHLLNPASPAHIQGFHGAGFYAFKTEESKAFWGLSLMENSGLPVSFSYIRERTSGDQYFQLSVASFILPGWSLGLGLSRWEVQEKANWNLQAGFLIKPERSTFSLGITWDHILPLEGPYKGERKWGLGFTYEPYQWLHLRADTLYNPDKKWNVAGGGLFTISRFLILRMGGQWHFTDKLFLLSGGVGLSTDKMGLDYGLSQTQKKNILHTLNIRGSF